MDSVILGEMPQAFLSTWSSVVELVWWYECVVLQCVAEEHCVSPLRKARLVLLS